jgi:hypothetical protein
MCPMFRCRGPQSDLLGVLEELEREAEVQAAEGGVPCLQAQH